MRLYGQRAVLEGGQEYIVRETNRCQAQLAARDCQYSHPCDKAFGWLSLGPINLELALHYPPLTSYRPKRQKRVKLFVTPLYNFQSLIISYNNSFLFLLPFSRLPCHVLGLLDSFQVNPLRSNPLQASLGYSRLELAY